MLEIFKTNTWFLAVRHTVFKSNFVAKVKFQGSSSQVPVYKFQGSSTSLLSGQSGQNYS
jgi:hypothetical protein